MTSIYEQLTKSLEFSRKSNYEKLEILDKQLEENKINEGKYLREVNKLKIPNNLDDEYPLLTSDEDDDEMTEDDYEELRQFCISRGELREDQDLWIDGILRAGPSYRSDDDFVIRPVDDEEYINFEFSEWLRRNGFRGYDNN
jgi:hypothetical protein